MAAFLENLWGSVFTPGPTPTLLIATNVTFAALQALLAALLIATYSIHFAILSVLCGGLWFSINWFANELVQAQAKEEEAERLRKKGRGGDWTASGEVADSADDEGEDTETEGLRGSVVSTESRGAGGDEKGKVVQGGGSVVGSVSGLQAAGGAESEARRRRGNEEDVSSSASTDSEWEKVDGDR